MKKRFLAVLMVLVLCIGLAPMALADSSVTYTGSADKFVFAPGSEYSPTDLFENFKGVMPGDSVTQQIEIKNDAANKTTVKIYMRALGAQEGSEELLSQLSLTVTANGGSKLFEAPANETAQLTDWVCLGTFASGADVMLDVTLNVPLELGNEYQNAVGYLDWEFAVEEVPEDQPRTGDDTPLMLYAAICLVSIGVITALVLTRKKKEN